jgi:hypothetical protein
MKGKIVALAICFSIVLCVGVGVAYYNTRTYGFDENAKVINKDDDKISIMDFDIYYEDIKHIIDKADDIVPEEHNTMSVITI